MWRSPTLFTLMALAACQAPPEPAASYVPHGRFPAAMAADQALRECRLQVESAGRPGFPTSGPRELRQIPPPPPVSRPEHASVAACMEAKGYRRADAR